MNASNEFSGEKGLTRELVRTFSVKLKQLYEPPASLPPKLGRLLEKFRAQDNPQR